MKKICCLILLFCVVGCRVVTTYDQFTPIEERTDKGIVIIKLARNAKYVNIKDLTFCSVDEKECIIFKNTKNDGEYIIAQIKEGTYFLAYLDIIRMDKKINGYIAFRVKNNELINLGNIKLKIKHEFFKQHYYLHIENNLPQVKEFVKNKYPFIDTEKIEFRPLQEGTGNVKIIYE